jgi:hypothetical protein
MEVPEMVLVALVPPIHADVMAEPGANKCVHGPWLENVDLESLLSEAATEIASGVEAGE